MIIERPILSHIAVQVIDLELSPFLVGLSRLDLAKLGGVGSAVVWRDWTPTVLSISAHRGGRQEGVVIVNEVGLLTVNLIDPGNGLDLEDGFTPGQHVRLVRRGSPDVPLFTGKLYDIARAMLDIDGSGRRQPVLTLTITDAVREHDTVTRYGAAGVDTFRQRITRLAASATAPLEIPERDAGVSCARTVYESSLSNHFTMTCNTMGAMWWVGADGITRFSERILGDDRFGGYVTHRYEGLVPRVRHHVRSEIGTGFTNFVNQLYATDHRTKIDPDNGQTVADDIAGLHYVDTESVNRWGERESAYDINWNGDDPDRATELAYRMIGGFRTPEAQALSVTWNAQENLEHLDGLEIGNWIYVNDPGTSGLNTPRIIIGIHHEIRATRWLVTLTTIGALPS